MPAPIACVQPDNPPGSAGPPEQFLIQHVDELSIVLSGVGSLVFRTAQDTLSDGRFAGGMQRGVPAREPGEIGRST